VTDGSEDKKDSVVQLIFQKDRTESVDFEVAFSALLATGVMSSLPERSISKIALIFTASVLLLLTLIRRMAIVGRFAKGNTVVSRTQIPIEFFSILSIYHIFLTVIQGVSEAIIDIQVGVFIVNIFLLMSAILFIIIQQSLFRDYFLFWGALFYSYSIAFQQAIEEDSNSLVEKLLSYVMVDILAQFAYLSLKNRLPDSDSEEIVELRNFLNRVEEEVGEANEPDTNELKIFLIFVPVLVFMFAIPVFGVSVFVGDSITVILTFVTVAVIGHIVQFLFLGYGAPLENERRSAKWQVVGLTAYVIIILLLFSNVSTPYLL
jgi:hypothetical protein